MLPVYPSPMAGTPSPSSYSRPSQGRQLVSRKPGTPHGCAGGGSEARDNMKKLSAARAGKTLGGYEDRVRHQVEWALTGYGEVKVKVEETKRKDSDLEVFAASSDEAGIREEEKGVRVHSGEPMGIGAADYPGEPGEGLESQGSNPIDPWHNPIVDRDGLPESVLPGRGRGREEIRKSQSDDNRFAQTIGKGCICLESAGVLNSVQHGNQEMSFSRTPFTYSCDTDNNDAMESAKNEWVTPPGMLLESSSDAEHSDDLLPPVNTTIRIDGVQKDEVVFTLGGQENRAAGTSFGGYPEKKGQSSNFGESQSPIRKRSSPAFECSGELEGSAAGSATSIPPKKKRKTIKRSQTEQLNDAQFSPPADVKDDRALILSEMSELQHNYAMALEENSTLAQENSTYEYQVRALQDQNFKANHEMNTMEDNYKDMAERVSELEEQIEDADEALVAEMKRRRNTEKALVAEIEKRKELEERLKKQEVKLENLKAKGENRVEKEKDKTKEWKVYATFLAQRSQK